MSLEECIAVANQIQSQGITTHKLDLARITQWFIPEVINTKSEKITLLGVSVENEEDRVDFANGNSMHESANIVVETIWEWQGKIYVAKVKRTYAYSCAGHSGGVEDCYLRGISFSWNTFDQPSFTALQEISWNRWIMESLPTLAPTEDEDINRIISFICYTLSASTYDRRNTLSEEIPQIFKSKQAQKSLTDQLLRICPAWKVNEQEEELNDGFDLFG